MQVIGMSDHDELDDELSDEALDAEIARRTAAMVAETVALGSDGEEAAPASLGIEGLTGAQLDMLVAARAGEVEPTDPAVKAALAVGSAQEEAFIASFDDEEGPSPAEVAAMDDDAFADYINRSRSYLEGGK